MAENKINFTNMKENNTKLVLDRIRFSGHVSRKELAVQTGLTTATITNIVNDLLQKKFVKEIGSKPDCNARDPEAQGERPAHKSGRKPIELSVNEKAGYVVGIELLAGRLTCILTDFSGKIVSRSLKEFSLLETGDEIMEKAVLLVEELLAQAESMPGHLLGIGIGTVGPIDLENEVILNPPNVPGLYHYPVRKLLSERFHVPVVHEHHTAAAAYCEKWFGEATHSKCMVMCCVENVGIGSHILINGHFFHGFHGFSGEIGHVIIDRNGPKCSCGNYGCLEPLADTRALINKVRKHFKTDPDLCRRCGIENADAIDLNFLVSHENVDEVRFEILKCAQYLASALCNFVMAVSPDTIVLAGDLPDRSPLYAGEVERIIHGRVYPLHSKEIKVYNSAFKENIGALGAAALALDLVF